MATRPPPAPMSISGRAISIAFITLLTSLAPIAHSQATTTSGTETSVAGGAANPNTGSLALTGVRRPPYRLHKSDVLEISFTFSPELDQSVTVQPDGYIALRSASSLLAEGLTLADLHDAVANAYHPILHDPEISILLKNFEKPHFVVGGQVGRPGKYELSAPTTVTEAIAVAGGYTEAGKHSQVVLFRRATDQLVESRVLNLKAMLASRNLNEDVELQPGDMLFVPQNRISKIKKFLPVASLSTFFTPAQF